MFGKKQSKKLNKKERERSEKAQAFYKDYQELVKKHGLDIVCSFHYSPNGIKAIPQLKEVDRPPIQTMSWGKAKRENLQTRTDCTHKMNEEITGCKKCGLQEKNWGKGKKGVTEEYRKAQEKIIKELEDKEKIKKD